MSILELARRVLADLKTSSPEDVGEESPSAHCEKSEISEISPPVIAEAIGTARGVLGKAPPADEINLGLGGRHPCRRCRRETRTPFARLCVRCTGGWESEKE